MSRRRVEGVGGERGEGATADGWWFLVAARGSASGCGAGSCVVAAVGRLVGGEC